jgi:hypothetical protein
LKRKQWFSIYPRGTTAGKVRIPASLPPSTNMFSSGMVSQTGQRLSMLWLHAQATGNEVLFARSSAMLRRAADAGAMVLKRRFVLGQGVLSSSSTPKVMPSHERGMVAIWELVVVRYPRRFGWYNEMRDFMG